MERLTKPCEACGREIQWRKKWERCWDEVKYCSEACKRGRVSEVGRALEARLLSLLTRPGAGASVCPSEAARAQQPNGWESLMEETRRAARRLAAAGKVEITQNGRVVDGSKAKGPIRVRLVNK